MDDELAMLNGTYGDSDDLDNLFDDGEFDLENANVSMNEPEPSASMPADPDFASLELQNLLNEGKTAEGEGFDLDALNNRELEIGEKVDEAVDYADIDDDDLADEEEPSGGPVRPPAVNFLSGIEDSAAEPDLDDLFGDDDDMDASFADPRPDDGRSDFAQRKDDVDSVASEDGAGAQGLLAALGERDQEMTEEEQREWRLQQALFQNREGDRHDTLGIDDVTRWVHMNFPDYNREEEAPFWNKLLPPKSGKWQGKDHKKPRPIRPTRVTLDVEPDQRLLFTTPAAVSAPFDQRSDLVHIFRDRGQAQFDALADSESDDDLPNGLTNEDLELMCTDFDTLSHLAENDGVPFAEPRIVGSDTDMEDDLNDFNDFERPVKKRRLGLSAHDIVTIHPFELPTFDNPEKMTARIAREVVLDLNDSRLLVEEVDQEVLKQRNRPGDAVGKTVTIKERLARRFKTSNDASYNLLQQNQKKVRGQLTNMTIDHSIPAIRLQYPYYQVKLTQRELRNWHRRQILFKTGIAFSKINKQKRKDFKNKPVREAFAKTRDLSVADNSYALLLEYSEEHPLMLSQAGMGNKIVNYYRKLDSNDAARPKADIGDTHVLMPEDKSPFNNFGHIDPGESTLALYNAMYRAPIFKQTQGPQDFLIVREVTGMNGQIHYLRNIDYQYVVGQELPTVPVPGPHARMVTTVSKNRLKAISFRIARKKKSHRLRVEEVTRHFPDTNDMQNRQKMKEFMAFNKEHKEWEMKGGEAIPDEEDIQKTLTPEEISLLESMQVGAQYLHDSGYAEDDNTGDKSDDEEKEEKKDLSIEQQLAPWKTTKNFIQATQGKAMLRLYGEGDPSGRGEAFSFIKTSMKGGFKAQGLSANENVAGQRGKNDTATGGHTYNVARQQKSYDDSIRSIWNKQKAVLSSQVEPDDIDDEGVDGQLEDNIRARNIRATPASGMQTPSGRRRDDETGTSFSKRSATSQAQKFLRITRKIYHSGQDEYEEKEVIESDPQVIKLYLKRKQELEAQNTSFADLVPTGDPEVDARHRKRLEEELARLEGTKKRRNKKKSIQIANNTGSPSAVGAGSPDADGNDATTPAAGGGRQTNTTQRKCANCGRVGHIKTNKKLCPLLNGEMQPDAPGGPMDSAAFMGAPPALT